MNFINPSKPFWRAEPLTPAEVRLLELVFAAHAASALRDNISHHVLTAAFFGSGRYTSALAAALCTLGGPHGPIEETYDLLALLDPGFVAIHRYITHDLKVPGWGNSFHRGCRDPLWTEVELQLTAEMGAKLEAVTNLLHSRGKEVYPNPSAYTAAAALIVGLPRAVSPFLFVAGRLSAWTERLVQG
jgi:citrate synthase